MRLLLIVLGILLSWVIITSFVLGLAVLAGCELFSPSMAVAVTLAGFVCFISAVFIGAVIDENLPRE
jgi:hypothetical protein